jgi:hypothetical protein
VLLCLELKEYRSLTAHSDEWVAGRTGLDLNEVRQCIAALADTGQIHKRGKRWSLREMRAITMQRTEDDVRRNKSFWSSQAIERFHERSPGMFSHNLFTVSEADFERIQDMHRAYYRAVRSVVAESTPGERIVLQTVSTQALGNPPAGPND